MAPPVTPAATNGVTCPATDHQADGPLVCDWSLEEIGFGELRTWWGHPLLRPSAVPDGLDRERYFAMSGTVGARGRDCDPAADACHAMVLIDGPASRDPALSLEQMVRNGAVVIVATRGRQVYAPGEPVVVRGVAGSVTEEGGEGGARLLTWLESSDGSTTAWLVQARADRWPTPRLVELADSMIAS